MAQSGLVLDMLRRPAKASAGSACVGIAGAFCTATAEVRWRLLLGASERELSEWKSANIWAPSENAALRDEGCGYSSHYSPKPDIFPVGRARALAAGVVRRPHLASRPFIERRYSELPIWMGLEFDVQSVPCRLLAYVRDDPKSSDPRDEPGWFAIASVEEGDWHLVHQVGWQEPGV